jgi:hypothetical protein
MTNASPLRCFLPSPLEGEGPGVRGHSTRRADCDDLRRFLVTQLRLVTRFLEALSLRTFSQIGAV